jgi:hypothetical protein
LVPANSGIAGGNRADGGRSLGVIEMVEKT